jgi:hypothetical protein
MMYLADGMGYLEDKKIITRRILIHCNVGAPIVPPRSQATLCADRSARNCTGERYPSA